MRRALALALIACNGKAHEPPPPPAPAPAHPALATPDAAVVTAPPRDVTGDGFRYPIPGSFTELRRPDGALAYTGTIAGALKPATLTVWATSEPFTGTLAQLVARETAAATEAGAPAPDVEPLDVAIGGKVKPGDARRMTIRLAERIELRALAVDQGLRAALRDPEHAQRAAERQRRLHRARERVRDRTLATAP